MLSSVYINLCWDLPWNRGVRDCLDIVTQAGTVNNCEYPAPCAMATISAVIVTIDATWRCLSHALLASEKYRDQAMAVWSGTSMAPIFAGTSQHGFPFAATEMSHFGGGGGARTYADGVDTAGIVFNTTPNMPNIEDQEAEYPVLYLFRKHLRDSGGPVVIAAAAPVNLRTRCTTRRATISKDCSRARARKCLTPSAWAAACRAPRSVSRVS